MKNNNNKKHTPIIYLYPRLPHKGLKVAFKQTCIKEYKWTLVGIDMIGKKSEVMQDLQSIESYIVTT